MFIPIVVGGNGECGDLAENCTALVSMCCLLQKFLDWMFETSMA